MKLEGEGFYIVLQLIIPVMPHIPNSPGYNHVRMSIVTYNNS